MSKPLAISAAFSVFAMAAFALFHSAGIDNAQFAGLDVPHATGAPISIEAPAEWMKLPQLPKLPLLAD